MQISETRIQMAISYHGFQKHHFITSLKNIFFLFPAWICSSSYITVTTGQHITMMYSVIAHRKQKIDNSQLTMVYSVTLHFTTEK